MDKIISALNEIQEMSKKYEIPEESILKLRDEMARARVCTPVIGKFSSGKSALINTVLGFSNKILKEDITPETAVPTEIVYSDTEEVVVVRNDGACESISIDDFRRFEADAMTVKCVRLSLTNSFLKEIPDVMLVDMPGFESGFEIHNKAIDNYVSQSMAYIVAFPADDMIVRSSVGNILQELCLHDMPLCVVITKYDKRNDDFDATLIKMKESLRKFIGDREIRYCTTSSFDGDAEEVEEFLREIQDESQEILVRRYIYSVMALLENTENYLRTTLKCSQMSESELDEQEEKIKKDMSELESKFSEEKSDFELSISECVEEMKNDIQCALEAEESTLVAMAMNNQKINDHLNTVVRNALTVSIKNRFIPKVERYLKRITTCLSSEAIGNINISIHFDANNLDKGITSSIVAVAAGFLIGLPILGIVAGIVMKLISDKKREQVKQEVRVKLRNEVFPQVIEKVGSGIESEVTKQIEQVNSSIEAELKKQREMLEKALCDIREKMTAEKAEKEDLEAEIKADLERIGEIRDGLQ